MRRFLVLDFETRSKADLKAKGAVEYAKDPSTEILCVAWRLGTREELREQLRAKTPAPCWSPFISGFYGELRDALKDPEVICVAHNALFEQSITKYVLARLLYRTPELSAIPPERWVCTAALAAALALPRSLEGACLALGLSVQKDMEGRRLILKYCKPRRETKNNKSMWHRNFNDLKRIMQYCSTDVDAETELFLRAKPLIPSERELWVLDQKINQRGFAIDRELVDAALGLIGEETERLTREMIRITNGEVKSANQRAKFLAFVQANGAPKLHDVKAKSVADALKSDAVVEPARRLLRIRQSLGKTSTAKYVAFRERVGSDGRVKDNLVFHAASTGRWSGAGVQPQNFPRGSIKNKRNDGESIPFDMAAAVEAVKTRDLEWVRFLYGDPMRLLASTLRGVIIASPGKELFCADYSAVEARMLFWFARHEAGIRAYAEGRDLYREMAAFIYSKPLEAIAKDSLERFVAKQIILGCGYGMGAKKFKAHCENFDVEISEELAERAVKAYREMHAPVTQLWYNIERAALAATQRPGTVFAINRVKWVKSADFLWCELPSGRRLAYYRPEIHMKPTPWGEPRATLHHYGVDQYTRKWGLSPTYGGKLTENIVQGASRDLMGDAMKRTESAEYEITLSVHDELLGERERGIGTAKEFLGLISTLPVWAAGAPIKAEGWSGERYRK